MKYNCPLRFKSRALCAALSALYIGSVFADAAVPDAGTLQQQTNPSLPASPTKNDIDMPEMDQAGLQDKTPFMVKLITIEGNLSIDSAVLHDMVKAYEGAMHTISDLQQACKRITEYYRAQGYPYARAVLPQQEITQGVVRIQVVEAKYGSINLQNQSAVSTKLVEAMTRSMVTGETIKQNSLDKSLLLLSDLPGVVTNANIKAGKALGESDLDIDIRQASRLNARVTADDFGNRYIRRGRLGASVNIYNPLGQGDVLSLNALTTGDRMQYGQLSYDLLLNGTGTHAGATYSYLYYTLGGTLQALDVHGSSEMSEAYLRQPLIRSRVKNLYAVLRYQHNNLSDHTDSAGVKKDRHLNSWVLSVNGDWRDAVLGGGVNSYVLSYTNGSVNFDNGDAKEADAVAADTQGNYAKWNYNINRLQQVNDKTQVWVSVSGQVAEGNLDSSQKMIVGGPYSVRAYDNGATSGDNGTLVTLELRRFLGNWYGNWQGLIFFDAAQVEVNDHRWAGSTGRNKAHLSGIGAGVTWLAPKQIQARIFAASSTGGNNSLTESSDHTVTWVELAKSF